MFAYSIFSYSQAAATARAFSAFSLFGYLELKAPTLAERAIEEERRAGEPGRKSLLDRLAAPDRGIVLTIFGGSEIVLPTLAEEYTALKSLVDSGRIRLDQLDAWLARLDEGLSWAAITLFGSCTIRRGEARDEQEALDRALRSGAIPAQHHSVLTGLIGATDSSVARTLGSMLAGRAPGYAGA